MKKRYEAKTSRIHTANYSWSGSVGQLLRFLLKLAINL